MLRCGFSRRAPRITDARPTTTPLGSPTASIRHSIHHLALGQSRRQRGVKRDARGSSHSGDGRWPAGEFPRDRAGKGPWALAPWAAGGGLDAAAGGSNASRGGLDATRGGSKASRGGSSASRRGLDAARRGSKAGQRGFDATRGESKAGRGGLDPSAVGSSPPRPPANLAAAPKEATRAASWALASCARWRACRRHSHTRSNRRRTLP